MVACVPRDARSVPMLPEALCLVRTGHPVAIARKDEAPTHWDLRVETQWGHDSVDVLGRTSHDLVFDRSGPDVAGAVVVEEPWEVRYGDAGHHRVDALFYPGQE